MRSWLTAGSWRSANGGSRTARDRSLFATTCPFAIQSSYGARNLVGRYQLRAGQRAGQAVQRDVPKIRSFPPAFEQDGRSDPSEAGRPHDRRRGALRGHRQGLRDHARALRADLQRGARGARSQGDTDDRHRGVRRSGRDRPDLLRPLLLPGPGRRRRQGLPAAGRRDARVREGGDRAPGAAHQAAAVRAAAHRRGADAEHDAVRRRGARARPPRRARRRSRRPRPPSAS